MKISNFILALWFILCLGAMIYFIHLGTSVNSFNCRITGVIVNFDSTEYICKNKKRDAQLIIKQKDTSQKLYYGKLLKVVYKDESLIDIR